MFLKTVTSMNIKSRKLLYKIMKAQTKFYNVVTV